MFESVKKIINLTPHEVKVWMPDGIRIIPESGKVCRIQIVSENAGSVLGIPVVFSSDRKVYGLPEPSSDTVYLVSSVVAKSVMRPDVLSPDTTDDGAIRDGQNGQIVAVKRLQCFCRETEFV